MSLLTLNFPVEQNFEPSVETKGKLLYTHKTARQFAGISIPGLFQTTNHTLHLILFIIIFLLEGVAFIFCIDLGVSWPAVLSAIVVDIVFAIFSHLPHKTIVQAKNELILEEGLKAINIQRRISRARFSQYFFYFLLFISAAFKIYVLMEATQGFIDSAVLFSIVAYTLAAFLHIGVSGYALFGLYVSMGLNSDHSAYIKSNGDLYFFDPAEPRRHQFESQVELTPVKTRNHQLVRIATGRYQFITNGIFTDADLVNIVMEQVNPNQRVEVIMQGIRHQLNILQTPPGMKA